MAESKKKKSTGSKSTEAPRRPETAGETLRAARIQRGVGLEEISAAVNIRVGQLRAIEDGKIDDLPGMTYAIGFVKSYAGYLKLNTNAIVQQFKEEHGVAPAAAQALHMPEPLADGPRPNVLVIGIAAFCGFLVLLAWTVFSGDDAGTQMSEQIPPAPAVGSVTGINDASDEETVAAPAIVAPPVDAPEQARQEIEITPGAAVEEAEEEVAAAPEPEEIPAQPAVAETAAATAAAATAMTAAEAETAEGPRAVKLPIKPDRDALRRKAELYAQQQREQAQIQIRHGKSRIVLSAKQSTWVEVSDSKARKTVFAKVLRPGEQFAVPDEPGLTLVTTNAGGLEVFVDGEAVQSLGGRGEIVSGVDLDPEDLKVVRQKARDRRR